MIYFEQNPGKIGYVTYFFDAIQLFGFPNKQMLINYNITVMCNKHNYYQCTARVQIELFETVWLNLSIKID